MKKTALVALFLLTCVVVVAPGISTAASIDVSAQDTSLSGKLEIFSWWAGDEGPALEALIRLYNRMYPNVEVINAAVTGGSGVNARAVLKTRMLGGDPPDTFQVHAGQELTGTWVVANRMEDLSWMYADQGWNQAFPRDLIDLLTVNGKIYTVPVNIHRSNVLWFIPANLTKWRMTAPTTWDEFLTQCPTLKAAGIMPLVAGETWTVNHLWESVALGVLGADGWNGIWTGTTSPGGPDMIAVWDKFGQILDCSNIGVDSAGLSWQQAVDKVVSGEAAYNIMGDWAAGYMMTTLGLTPGEGFGYRPSPDTAGNFLWLSDSFGLPIGAPDRDNTIAWLEELGSLAGQNAFNPLKGSIPARTDAVAAAPGLYSRYSQSAAVDWASNRLVGSLVHGVAANERFMGDFNTVMEVFLTSRSSTAAANAMAVICATSGACGGM